MPKLAVVVAKNAAAPPATTATVLSATRSPVTVTDPAVTAPEIAADAAVTAPVTTTLSNPGSL
jgi:hypothetical protein